MDTAGELAKCQESAEKAVKHLMGSVGPAEMRITTERVTTALLAARGDALRTFGTPYRADQGPGWGFQMGEELEAEARNRRLRGL